MLRKILNPKVHWNHLMYRLHLPKKSYSQVGEDLFLDFFLQNKNRGFYVDIGANHPKRFSNTCIFYERGWSGINIEPNATSLALFKISRKRDINLNIGIAQKSDILDFFIFHSDTLCTFSRESADAYIALGHKLLGVKKIKTEPLKVVLDEHITKNTEIDFFSIDTEGLDEEVIRSNDWSVYRPKFIVIESLDFNKDSIGGTKKRLDMHGEESLREYLKEVGYSKIADTYINSIYISDEFALKQKMF